MAPLNKRPHAVMFPCPAQGHMNAMMQLAQILHGRGFYITFGNTQYIQDRLIKSGSVESVKSLPDFKFEAIPDGLVSFPQKTARKLGVPRVSFWMHSACGFSTYFFAPLLVEKG